MTILLDLDAIEACAAAATPGPWGARSEDVGNRHGLEHWVMVPVKDYCHIFLDSYPTKEEPFSTWTFNDHNEAAGRDAAFIANARTDVPALCQEVRYLRAQLELPSILRDMPEEQVEAVVVAGKEAGL